MAVFAGKQNIKLFLQHFPSITEKLLLSTEFTNDKSWCLINIYHIYLIIGSIKVLLNLVTRLACVEEILIGSCTCQAVPRMLCV